MIPKLAHRQRYWLEHIQACEASGKSMVEYAETQGFPVQTLYASKKRLANKGVLSGVQTPRFQRVQMLDAKPSSQWRVGLPNGVSIAFVGDVNSGSLASIFFNTASYSFWGISHHFPLSLTPSGY